MTRPVGSPRTRIPALAVFITLLMSFVVLPLTRAKAQTTTTTTTSTTTAATSTTTSSSTTSTTSPSTSTSTSTSTPSSTTSTTGPSSTTTTTTPAEGCHGEFTAGTTHPGDTVHGTLSLNSNCTYPNGADVTLNGAKLHKNITGGTLTLVVKIESMTSGTMDDPVTVTLHQGVNTAVVSGQGRTASGADAGTVTINASFDLEPGSTATTTAVTVVPVNTTTTSSGSGTGLALTGFNLWAMVALALVAIALGSWVTQSYWAVPVGLGTGRLISVSRPVFNPPFGDSESWSLEALLLGAVSYVLGPPPGRHTKKGPRGLVPTVRDWVYRDR